MDMGYSLQRRRSQFMTEMEHLFIFVQTHGGCWSWWGWGVNNLERKKSSWAYSLSLCCVLCVVCLCLLLSH